MTTRSKGGEGHRLLSEKMKSAALGLTLLLSPYVALTQTNVRSYHLSVQDGQNMKNYATVYGNPGDDFSAMVGTIQTEDQTAGGGVIKEMIHFIFNGGDGEALTSEVYSDPGFVQEHGVDIEFYRVNPSTQKQEFFITALCRPQPDANIPGYDNDVIKILIVDEDGTIQDDFFIELYENSDPTKLMNLYPLHTIWYNNLLYICGYYTTGATTYPNYPDFTSNKKAFVVKIDPFSPYARLAKGYNHAVSGNTSKDFDMAMRMETMFNNTDIFVTGSVTGFGGSSMISGVMSKRIDKTNLTVTGDNSYTLGQNAYGIGLAERTNGGSYAENYMVGNYFIESNGMGSTYSPQPQFLWVNRINDNFTPITALPSCMWHASYDYAWVLQKLNFLPYTVLGGFLTIAGMQQNSACISTNPPAPDNVNPFIARLDFTWNTTTGIVPISTTGVQFWKTYLNQTGTGDATTNSNAYPSLFGWISNMAWSPTFAAENPQTGGYIMSAPKWHTNGAKLELKYIHTDNIFEVNDCNGSWAADCNNQLSFHTNSAAAPGSTASSIDCTPDVLRGYSAQFTYTPAEDDCNSISPPVFRTAQAGVVDNEDKIEAKIFPNPASSYIDVQLMGSMDPETQLEIRLVNLVGQNAGQLYKGSAVTLSGNSRLPLPYVAAGLYMVQVWNNNQLLSQHKLSIQ